MPPDSASWIGVAIAVVAMLHSVLNGRTARSAARDKLEFDAKIVTLETGLSSCEDKHKECEKRHEECKEDHKSNAARLTALEAKVLAEQHPGDSGILRKKKGQT